MFLKRREYLLACTKFRNKLFTIITLSIWTTEFWTIITAENFIGVTLDITKPSLISILGISATLSLMRNKAFVSDLLNCISFCN